MSGCVSTVSVVPDLPPSVAEGGCRWCLAFVDIDSMTALGRGCSEKNSDLVRHSQFTDVEYVRRCQPLSWQCRPISLLIMTLASDVSHCKVLIYFIVQTTSHELIVHDSVNPLGTREGRD